MEINTVDLLSLDLLAETKEGDLCIGVSVTVERRSLYRGIACYERIPEAVGVYVVYKLQKI